MNADIATQLQYHAFQNMNVQMTTIWKMEYVIDARLAVNPVQMEQVV
jgi:hypothetical protein